MKRIFAFVVFIIIIVSLFADTINYKQALQVTNLEIQIQEKENYYITNVFEMRDNNGTILAYVFHLNPKGFIAISTDRDISPVIGYSFRNNFITEDIWQNTGYQYVKKDMQLRLKAIPLTSEEVKSTNRTLWRNYLEGNIESPQSRDDVWPPEGYSPTGGWVATQWNQSPTPYWNFCPLDPTNMQRCVVGCVATSLSQIMNYHHWIGDASFNNNDDYYSTYTSPAIHIDDDHNLYDFPSFPELNPYLDDLKVAYANYDNITNDMISALCFGAGVSVEMNYSSEASGAYISDIYYALLYKFGYDTASYVNYISTAFYNNLQNDMMEARPANFGVSGAGGHSIICDGYNGTNGKYHLNMGWGGYSDGWYTLPTGMPAGFNVIDNAVINIEGGTVPFNVSGLVYGEGAPVEDTYVTLDGPLFYDCYVDDPQGYYEILYVYEGTYQATAIIELAGGGYFYKTQEVVLNETNNTIIFMLDSYETITGTVTGSISPEDCHINVYQNNQLMSSGVADATGNFIIYGVLPGEYTATASINGNYFDEMEVVITATNQEINFQLEDYPYDHIFNYADDPVGQLQILPDMSCGIRLAGEDLTNHTDNAFAKVQFLAPFDSADGELYGQIWNDDLLISEKQIFDFTDGELVEVILEDFAPIDLDNEYYVGYRIHSFSGVNYAAYHDAGPRVEGKGAYLKTSIWTPLSLIFDYNFCIKAIAISQNSLGTNDNITPIFVNNLENNYPNPFNPTTNISFSIEENGYVSLNIYNIRGQLTKTLVSENLDAGVHIITWNGKDNNNQSVSSGIYLYEMKAVGKYTNTKKMLMLK
jgi:hypothetical protein